MSAATLLAAAAAAVAAGVLRVPALAAAHELRIGVAAAHEPRIGTAPRLPAGTTLVAGTAALKTMSVAVTLAPRDPVALRNYASDVGDPSSPSYRHYLTPGEFRARFAPRRRTLVKVEAELRSHGLHPGSVTANGLAIHVRADAAAIEHAFDLKLIRVRLASGRDAIYNAQAPAVDADVAHVVQAVVGLSSLAPMRRLDVTHAAVASRIGSRHPRATHPRGTRTSAAHVATGGPQPCVKAAQVAPGQGAYTADQVATAYGFSGVYATGDRGQGVTIGVYELEPNLLSDIAAYQRCYHTHTQVSYLQVDKGAGTGVGEGEAALDIEQLIGLAPRAKLIVYQGPNNSSDDPGTGPYDTLAAMVSQDQVQVISNSWGECESLEGTTDAHAEDTLLEEAATQGQTFVSAAGDSGSTDCWSPPPHGNTDNALTVDDPASQPFATAVGGTSMTAIGPPPAELVWDDDDPDTNYSRFGIERGAGGGGLSSLWTMPAFQSSASSTLAVIGPNSSGVPCGVAAGSYCRELPDVSADSDPMRPYLDYWNGTGTNARSEMGWQGTGGTSGAAPVWAALFALADASRSCRGTLVGFADPALYALASQSQSTYFNDVTTGNNDFTPSGNTSGLYAAGVGYDMASGLGTPKAATLVPGLCAQAVKIDYPGQRRSFYDQHVRMRVQAHLGTGQTGPLSYEALRLPAGLHLNRSTGVISGRVLQAGLRTVTLSATSASGGHGTIRFTWAVARRPQLAVTATGSGSTPELTIRAQSGAFEPGLLELTVSLPQAVSLTHTAHAVQVLDPDGLALAHRVRYADHVLTIELAAPAQHVRLLFPAGLLHIRGGALGGAMQVAVGMVDSAGSQVTLTRSPAGL